MPGLVHIYTGDGKGKTTAAVGLGVRAAGRGLRVLMVQFLKGRPTGEMEALRKLEPLFTLHRGTEVKRFTWEMDEGEKEQTRREQENLLAFAAAEAAAGKWDVLILDEIMAAISTGMLELRQVVELTRGRPEELELVMTGRNAPAELVALADYVSEIKAVKHPLERGVPPRKGIEC